MIEKIYFDKACYSGNTSINLLIENDNSKEQCQIEVFELDSLIKTISVALKSGLNKINLGKFKKKTAGYRVMVKDKKNNLNSSFSIDPNSSIIRYGFLSDFKESDNDEDIKWMNLNHLNYIQFYDWSYRHDNMVPLTKLFRDAMGKEINLDIIKHKINTCKKYGMIPMAYGPIYAASKNYFEKHKKDAYFAAKNKALTFIDTFYFMNIGKKSNWPKHILNEYKKSINDIGFAGIHLDTYGYPKRALDFDNEVVDIAKEIPLFLEEISGELNPAPLIFNNVGAWPLVKTVSSNQIATYIEVWSPFETFYHLKQLINTAKKLSKPVILAAYISSFRLDRTRALFNSLLTTFYINTLGATHLFLGEEGCVITQGYYSDYTKLDKNEIKIIQKYQDYFVVFQEILFDDSFVDISMTYCGGDNEEYVINGNYSLTAEKNKISVVIRSNGLKHLLSFLNLEQNDNYWNLGKDEPSLSSKLQIKVQVFGNVKCINYANPDDDFCHVEQLPFVHECGDRSDIVKFEVPSFKVGAIIWFEEII